MVKEFNDEGLYETGDLRRIYESAFLLHDLGVPGFEPEGEVGQIIGGAINGVFNLLGVKDRSSPIL